MTSNHSVFGGVGVIMSEASVNPLKGRGHKLPLPLQYVSVALSGPQGKVAALKHQSQYIVVYKDSTRSPNKYFGPFVSMDVAQDFMDGLPEPQTGGGKTFKHMSPYTYDECGIARDVILRVRTHGSYLDHA